MSAWCLVYAQGRKTLVRLTLLLGASLALASSPLLAKEQASSLKQSPAQIALIADRIIDGHSRKLSKHTVVLIQANKIIGIGGENIIPAGAHIIDLGNATLLPGLIDVHSHPFMFDDDYQQTHLQASSATKTLKALKATQGLLNAGWTSLRIMGDADVYHGVQDLRRSFEEGLFVGPRLNGASHYLSVTGGGGDINFFSPEQNPHADGLVVDGPNEVRKAIRNEVKYGSDWIKLLVTGAFLSVGDNPRNIAFSPEELETAMAEAKRLNVPVAAHAHASEGINVAIRAGAKSIEHGTYLNDEGIRLMVKHGTFLVPTIYIGDYYTSESQDLRAQEKNDYYIKHERGDFLKRIGRAHTAGVKIAVGVDLGGLQFDPTLSARELALLVEAGMSPMQAIQAATRVGAELLGKEKNLGTLEAGKLADIIAVRGNPLEDISELEAVHFVMIDGAVVKNVQTSNIKQQ